MSEYKATFIKATTTDDVSQKTSVILDGTSGLIRAGSHGKEGNLQLVPGNIVEGPQILDPNSTGQVDSEITSSHATIHMRASNAHVRIGGGMGSPGMAATEFPGQNGKVSLQDSAGHDMIVLDAQEGDAWLGGADTALAPFHFAATNGALRIGGGAAPSGAYKGGRDGLLKLQDANGEVRVYLEGGPATLRMRDALGNEHALLDGAGGNLWLGGKKADGDVVLFARKEGEGEKYNRDRANATIHLDGQTATVRLRDIDGREHALLDGAKGDLWLGGRKASGEILLFARGETDNRDMAKATIQLEGRSGEVRLRGRDADDDLVERIHLDAAGGNLWLGGNGVDGDLMIFSSKERDENTDQASIFMSGNSGDIVLRNADCAEDFDVAAPQGVEPGTLMVLDREGGLEPCKEAYDRKVAGVISGAGGYKPGIVLDRQRSEGRLPVALMGKVFCKVDAEHIAVEVGDLLTTSPRAGHAMKATDPSRSFGAVIGKALRPLASGQGLIPILVSLQ